VVAARCGTHELVVSPTHVEPSKPPGPTLPLDAFLLNIPDTNRKPHPTKVTMAVEFADDSKVAKDEAALKALIPRLRDAVLGYLRRLTYEELSDPAASDQLRSELIFRVRAVGANGAERVLITDLVVQ
jgi:flagellar basal body-associated protein FliL